MYAVNKKVCTLLAVHYHLHIIKNKQKLFNKKIEVFFNKFNAQHVLLSFFKNTQNYLISTFSNCIYQYFFNLQMHSVDSLKKSF